MSLSIQKCVVIEHGHPDPGYGLDGMTLSIAQFTRDVGVIVSPDLDFSEHIHVAAKTASNLVSTIFRWLVVTALDLFIRLFNTIVIPEVLYAVPIWNSHLRKYRNDCLRDRSPLFYDSFRVISGFPSPPFLGDTRSSMLFVRALEEFDIWKKSHTGKSSGQGANPKWRRPGVVHEGITNARSVPLPVDFCVERST